jgi:cellulose synthase/poly-beta-1,6-N-acetylglucosamine synthase-like glycosyltransferase
MWCYIYALIKEGSMYVVLYLFPTHAFKLEILEASFRINKEKFSTAKISIFYSCRFFFLFGSKYFPYVCFALNIGKNIYILAVENFSLLIRFEEYWCRSKNVVCKYNLFPYTLYQNFAR